MAVGAGCFASTSGVTTFASSARGGGCRSGACGTGCPSRKSVRDGSEALRSAGGESDACCCCAWIASSYRRPRNLNRTRHMLLGQFLFSVRPGRLPKPLGWKGCGEWVRPLQQISCRRPYSLQTQDASGATEEQCCRGERWSAHCRHERRDHLAEPAEPRGRPAPGKALRVYDLSCIALRTARR